MKNTFDSIESVVASIRRGKMVIVVDDADRENEGDLILAAQFVTPAAVNFMAKHGRGPAACCSALATRRRRWTWRDLLVCGPSVCFAKS